MTAGLGSLLVGVSALINPVGVLVASLGALAGIRVAELIQKGQANVRAGELTAAQGQVKYQKARLDPNYLKGQIASLQGQKTKLGKVGLGQSSMAIDAQIADFQQQLARLEGRGQKPIGVSIPKVSLPAVGGGGGGAGRSRSGGGGGRSSALPKAEKEFVAERIEPLSDYMESLFSRSTEILNSLKTPLDTFNEQVAELDLLAKNNLISFDTFNAKLAEYRQELDVTLPASEALTGVWEDYANAAGTASTAMNDLQQVTVNVGTEFANMVASGKLSFADLTSSLLRDITRVIIQLKVVTPLMNSLFGAQGQGGGLLSQLGASIMNQAKGFSMPTLRGVPSVGGGAPVPAFANGGMPPVGRPVLVGERGAELVTFGQQARVHSNQATKGLLGGGSNVVVNIHNAPEGTKAQRSNQGGVDIIDVVLGRVASSINTGSGAIPNALKNRYGLNSAMGNG
jgi:phage-related minor tail protein